MKGPETVGFLIAMIIILPIAIGIGALIQAIFIRAAAKWVCKLDISFGRAIGTALLIVGASMAAGFALGLTAGIVAGVSGGNQQQVVLLAQIVTQVLALVTNFFIAAAIMCWMIRVSFPRAMLMQLVVLGLSLALVVLIAIIVVPVVLLMR